MVDNPQKVQGSDPGIAKSLRSHMRVSGTICIPQVTRTTAFSLSFAFGRSTSGTVDRKAKLVEARGNVFVEAFSANGMSTRVNVDVGTHRHLIHTDTALNQGRALC